MNELKRRILVVSTMALVFACGSSDLEKDSVSSAAVTVPPTWTVVQTPYPCIDVCEKPTCGCFSQKDLCAPGVAADQPCSTVGAECDLIYDGTLEYATVRCTQSPQPAPQTTWQNTSGAIEVCLDICGVGNCNCVRSRCPAGASIDGPCTSVGASCNLVGVNDYQHVTCRMQ